MKSVNQGLIAFALIACGSLEAQAQSFSNVPFTVGNNPPAATSTPQLTDLVAFARPIGDFFQVGTLFLPLAAFASSDEFRALNAEVNNMNAQVNKMNIHMSEGIAMASAITIVPPNPGDRFSLNLSGADFDSQNAGSVSATYRVSDQALVYAGYARGNTQNLGKVGISFSFH